MEFKGECLHSIDIHTLTSVELPVLEAPKNLLGKGGSALLEGVNFLRGSSGILEVLENLLHVTYNCLADPSHIS